MNKLILLLLLTTQIALAGDSWLCTEDGSERDGNTFRVCGMADAGDEGEARLQALSNARAEFQALCGDECQGVRIITSPGRTSCEATERGYYCVRLVVYTLDSPGFFEKLFIKSQ